MMISSFFFGYLSPQWKRLIRTVVIVNLIWWILLLIVDNDPDIYSIILMYIVLNLLLSYVFELFVKKKQKNEFWISILCLTINIIPTIFLSSYAI